MKQKLDIGRIGEKAAELELLKLGFDVINLNDFRNNYENADLICMNPATGKSVMIQVKTGTTKNIMTGSVSKKNCKYFPFVSLNKTLKQSEKSLNRPTYG